MHRQPEQSPRKTLFSIQILRGLAAGAVMVAHTIEHPLSSAPNALVMLGTFGVQVFFVISGFIIAYANQQGSFSPSTFLVRRIFRIVPLYWICTFLVFFGALYAPNLFKSTVANVEYLIRSLFFIPMASPGDPEDWRPLLKLGWSLNYEMFFYAIFALFWWCRSTFQRTIWISIVLGVLVIGSFFVKRDGSLIAVYLHTNLLTFLAGMWLAEAEKCKIWEKFNTFTIVLLIILAVPLLYTTFTTELVDLRYFDYYLVSLATSVLLVVIALVSEPWTRNLKDSFFVKVGQSSYSLYLTHMFVVGFGWFVIGRLGLTGYVQYIAIIGIMITCIIVANISYRLIERPSNKLGHVFTSKLLKRERA